MNQILTPNFPPELEGDPVAEQLMKRTHSFYDISDEKYFAELNSILSKLGASERLLLLAPTELSLEANTIIAMLRLQLEARLSTNEAYELAVINAHDQKVKVHDPHTGMTSNYSTDPKVILSHRDELMKKAAGHWSKNRTVSRHHEREFDKSPAGEALRRKSEFFDLMDRVSARISDPKAAKKTMFVPFPDPVSAYGASSLMNIGIIKKLSMIGVETTYQGLVKDFKAATLEAVQAELRQAHTINSVINAITERTRRTHIMFGLFRERFAILQRQNQDLNLLTPQQGDVVKDPLFTQIMLAINIAQGATDVEAVDWPREMMLTYLQYVYIYKFAQEIAFERGIDLRDLPLAEVAGPALNEFMNKLAVDPVLIGEFCRLTDLDVMRADTFLLAIAKAYPESALVQEMANYYSREK